jgi:hypothetical protein
MLIGRAFPVAMSARNFNSVITGTGLKFVTSTGRYCNAVHSTIVKRGGFLSGIEGLGNFSPNIKFSIFLW